MNAIQRIEKIDQTQFLEFETTLRNDSPGLISAIKLFRELFPNKPLAFSETHIKNIVIEKEVALLKKNRDLNDFLRRNGLEGIDALTEQERRLFKKR